MPAKEPAVMHESAEEPVIASFAPEIMRSPLANLVMTLHEVVAQMRLCAPTPDLDAAIVEGGMLLADGHYAAAWDVLGRCLREIVAGEGMR